MCLLLLYLLLFVDAIFLLIYSLFSPRLVILLRRLHLGELTGVINLMTRLFQKSKWIHCCLFKYLNSALFSMQLNNCLFLIMCNVRFYALEIYGIWVHLVWLLPVMVGKLVYIPMFLLFEQGNIMIIKKEYVTSGEYYIHSLWCLWFECFILVLSFSWLMCPVCTFKALCHFCFILICYLISGELANLSKLYIGTILHLT